MLKGSITISISIYGCNIFYDTFLWFMNWFGFDFGFPPRSTIIFCVMFRESDLRFEFVSWEGLASKRLPKHIGIMITFVGAFP